MARRDLRAARRVLWRGSRRAVAAGALSLPLGEAASGSARRRSDGACAIRCDGPPRTRPIVNGTQIAIGQAPWQVAVFAECRRQRPPAVAASIIQPTEDPHRGPLRVRRDDQSRFPRTTSKSRRHRRTPTGLANRRCRQRLVRPCARTPTTTPPNRSRAADDVAVLTLADAVGRNGGARCRRSRLSGAGVAVRQEGTGRRLDRLRPGERPARRT